MDSLECMGQCEKKLRRGEDVCEMLYNCIEKTLTELENAKIAFNEAEAKDEEIIDSLIYKINECEKRYSYLLKIAQKEGLYRYPGLK